MASSSRTGDGDKKVKIDKKRKYKSTIMTTPKIEGEDDDNYSKDDEEFQNLCLPRTTPRGLSPLFDGYTSEGAPTKKTKFSVTKFPQTKVCAVVKPASKPRLDENKKEIQERLAKLKAAIEDLSDDWDVIMKIPEIATIDDLNKEIEKKDADISKLKQEKTAALNDLLKMTEDDNVTISRLRKENTKLREDFAQQADQIETFENWKKFMKTTLEL